MDLGLALTAVKASPLGTRSLRCEQKRAKLLVSRSATAYKDSCVRRAEPGVLGQPGDGLWTDESDVPVLAFAADCLPIALVRTDGDWPAVAVLHAGWRGLLGGILAAGVAALGGRPRACIGPAIGPCCYEVGAELSEPFAEAFGADVVEKRKLDLRTAAERALRAAGVVDVDHVELCTACNPELLFSHRRTGKPRGVQGVIARVA